jgi:hypothetical protein
MPINIYSIPSLDKEKDIIMNKDGWKWLRETEENP